MVRLLSFAGQEKLHALKENANTFRRKIMNLGLEVLGDWDSPVVPIMLYQPCKIAAFSREALKEGVCIFRFCLFVCSAPFLYFVLGTPRCPESEGLFVHHLANSFLCSRSSSHSLPLSSLVFPRRS